MRVPAGNSLASKQGLSQGENIYLVMLTAYNLLPEASAHDSSYLTNIFDIYGLSQLIYTEPTRFTPVSKTLIDLFIIIH